MFISRDLLTDIRQWLDREKILILKGSRQVGKTTLLKFLEQELKKEYPTLFFSIDLEMGNPLFKEPKLFVKFLESHMVSGKRLYVFLDEFQYSCRSNERYQLHQLLPDHFQSGNRFYFTLPGGNDSPGSKVQERRTANST